ncbi:hypothetical protein ACHAWF_002529 [Thalassiosira exigua]
MYASTGSNATSESARAAAVEMRGSLVASLTLSLEGIDFDFGIIDSITLSKPRLKVGETMTSGDQATEEDEDKLGATVKGIYSSLETAQKNCPSLPAPYNITRRSGVRRGQGGVASSSQPVSIPTKCYDGPSSMHWGRTVRPPSA